MRPARFVWAALLVPFVAHASFAQPPRADGARGGGGDERGGAGHYRAGRCAAAVEYFARAVRARPTDANAVNNLGMAYAALGRRAEAEDALKRAVSLKRDFAAAHYNL